MKRMGRLLRGIQGLSLIELLVVVAIMGILATLTAVAVTGTTTSTKSVSKTQDERVVLDADKAFTGKHPQGRHPTIDGCKPGTTLSAITFVCSGTGTADGQFIVDETVVGVDVDGDGNKTDTALAVVPVLWDQFFGTGDSKKTFQDFVDLPKHAFDLIGTEDGWKTGRTLARAEDAQVIRAPFSTTGDTGDLLLCRGDLSKCPVWVFNEDESTIVLLPESRY